MVGLDRDILAVQEIEHPYGHKILDRHKSLRVDDAAVNRRCYLGPCGHGRDGILDELFDFGCSPETANRKRPVSVLNDAQNLGLSEEDQRDICDHHEKDHEHR